MDHKHLNISYGTAGGGVSASADSSKGSSRGITNQNSQLVASNIHINTADSTTVAGANMSASDSLNIDTKHLNVSSVQDSSRSDNRSQGMSISASLDGDITGAGVNAGNSRSRDKQTVLTTLTGNQVNIDVVEGTTIRGALIAAVDNQGNDNGNLTLKTDTLEVGSMNNRHSSKSMSMGLNVSVSNKKNKKTGGTDSSISSVGIDYSNDRSNSKTKTLGTLGAGSIEVANVDGSNTKMLNRDIKDNEIDIYNISSHKGLKGTVDVRMFTEKGRQQIAYELKKSKVGFYDVAKDIMSEKELTILDTFSYQGYKVAFYDGMQTALRDNEGGLRDIMADPNATKEERQAAMQQVADGINAQLGIKPGTNKVALISTDATVTDPTTGEVKKIKGAFHKPSGDIVLIDPNLDSTGDMTNTLAHEIAHAGGYGEDVSKVLGASLEDYANFGMWNYGDGETLASSNTHNGMQSNTTGEASKTFVLRHDRGALDYRIVIAPYLSKQDQENILNNMQKLTNKKLILKKNGKVTYSTGKGTDRPKGTELIKRLIDSKKTVTVTTGTGGNAEYDTSSKGAINGVGSGTRVKFDKDSNPLIQTVDSVIGKNVLKNRPNQIGLGHELIHADRSMRGQAIDYSITDKNGVPNEENATVGLKYNKPDDITENDLRNEQGVEPRGRY